jgi:hypothetical protein
MVAISSWSTQYRQLPPHTPCAYLQSQLQSMNFLTELGGTTCGEPHIAMEKSNPCGLEKMYKAQEERRIGSHQLKSTKQGIAYQTLDKFYNKADIPWVNLIWNTYYSNGEVPHATKDKGSSGGGMC